MLPETSKNQKENTTDEDAVLCAWLGLPVSTPSYTEYFFGTVEQRPELILHAETRSENNFLTTSEKVF